MRVRVMAMPLMYRVRYRRLKVGGLGSYCAARIQTSDRGRPVAMYTVARELGHSSLDMVSDRYGHLHDRAESGGTEEVSFRVETYQEQLGDRLEALV